MSDIREDVATALRYRRSGRSDRAEPTYRSIIETDPGCAEALHLLGVVEAQVAPILPAFRPCVEAFGDDALPPGGEGRLNGPVFDRRAVRLHRDRAAVRLDRHDFLLREVGERLADRLDDVKRRFPLALDLGCHGGQLGRLLGGRGSVETLVQCDLSPAMVRRAGPCSLAADEEWLPFGAGRFDLILSCLSLHWVNDLPGTLIQARQALRPDGMFLAAMLGGATLAQLRAALAEAEVGEEGGLSPRVSPFADVRDAGDLLGRAGFAMPVVDAADITVSYPDPFRLMNDLRGMGETNAVRLRRRRFTRRATMHAAAALYRERFADASGRLPADFQVITLTAWAPHPSQQKPLRPGSAAGRLADALGAAEIPAGEKARPKHGNG